MARNKLQNLIKVLGKEIEKAERIAELSKHSAIELAEMAHLSPSMSGDREHSENSAILNRERLYGLRLLKEELASSLNSKIPKSVEPPCFVEIENVSGRKASFYVVNHPVNIPKVKFISLNSPLGRTLIHKKVEENLQLEVEDNQGVQGKILSLG
jgi:transcription elongation GreA/GreB family factor